MSAGSPTAFVSYSRDGDDHEAWVRRFATDLRERDIDAMLDQWDLELGDSITAFMEKIAGVDHALLVCTEAYAAKANERAGGVGWEYSVLTGAAFVGGGTLDIIPVLRRARVRGGHPPCRPAARGLPLVQVVRDGSTPNFAAGDLMIVRGRSAEWTEAIERCDAIVLIGGVGGTRTTGRLGLDAGKLVLPHADTGGDAMSFFTQLLANGRSRPSRGSASRRFRARRRT